MNDPVVFNTFLRDVAGFNEPNARNAISGFVGVFTGLLSISKDDLDQFAKDTHAANSGLPIADRIVLPAGGMLALHSIHFELRDRYRCNALPDRAYLQGLNGVQLALLRMQRSAALEWIQILKDRGSTLPDMTIPKLTNSNYDEFHTAFSTMLERIMGAFDIPLSYLLRTDPPGNFEERYASREARLYNCIVMRGPLFQSDSEMLYALFVQHIGTQGTGSTVVNNHQHTRNGRQCFLDINNHFRNRSYLENKAAKAERALQSASYSGDKRNFTLETYYTIMTNAFNDLEKAGNAHYLRDNQKVTKFENGLIDPKAVDYAIIAKEKWNTLPEIERTFDSYYNIFSSYMTKFKTMLNTNNNQNRRINTVNLEDNSNGPGRGRGNRGNPGRNGRGRGRGRGRGGRGRGRGRFQPYQNNYHINDNNNFRPEAKMYPPLVYRTFTVAQKQAITALKLQQGWINAHTPPPGFVVDNNTGTVAPHSGMVSAVAASIYHQNATINNANSQIPPPPPPQSVPPPSPSVPNHIDTREAGSHFGRSGQRQQPSDQSSVGMVSINGQPYRGRVFDNNGNPLS